MKKTTIRIVAFAFLMLATTSKPEITSLFKKTESSVQETRRITNNLFKNHPYAISLLSYFLLRHLTNNKSGHLMTISGTKVNWSSIHDSLPTAALATSISLDVLYNKSYSIPGQFLTAIKDLLDTYGTSKNTEFITKSFEWLITTLKKVPQMVN